MKYTNLIAIPRTALFDLTQDRFISESLHVRRRNGAEQIFTNTNVAIDPSTTFQIEEGFYAGIKFNHFGHFLLESLSRLANLKSSGHTNVIWVSKTNNRIFSKWQIDIFHLLGIADYNHIVISEPTLISNVEVATQEYIIWDLFTPLHKRFLGIYKPVAKPSGRKLWLSREYVSGGWRDEQTIQNILIKNGWTIFHPEKYSITEQLEMMLTSDTIAGIEGSAFHTLIFAYEVKQKVMIFSRITKDKLKNHKVNENYRLIANCKNIDQIEYTIEQYPVYENGPKTESIVNCFDIFDKLNIQILSDDLKENLSEFTFAKSKYR